MKTPIDIALDGVDWKPTGITEREGGLLYATHEGVLKIGPFEFRCHVLNTGERVIDAEDMMKFFAQLGGE